jgi:hypothetical protein
MAESNPYESPKAASLYPEFGARPKCQVMDYSVATQFAVISAFTTGLFYVAIALVIENSVLPSLRTPGEPVLSYGAMAIVILPLMGVLGAFLGVAIYLIRIRKWLAAIAICVMGSLGGLALMGSLWLDQMNRYGLDVSAIVLYVPGIIFSLLLFVVGIIVGLWRIFK